MRRVQPQNIGLRGHKIKVPPRPIATEIFTKSEVNIILTHMGERESWYFPIFATWISTGMRNGELIGLTWDCIDFEDQRIKVVKTLRRIDQVATRREWAGTKNGKHRYIPMSKTVVQVLLEHREAMQQQGLFDPQGLVFLTKRTKSNLYDLLLERVWKRTLDAVNIRYGNCILSGTFLSHTLAVELTSRCCHIAGHRLEELLRPTRRLAASR